MKFSSIILGLLAGLLAPVLVVAIMAAAVVVSLGQNVAAKGARNKSRSTTTHARSSSNAEVIKMPDGRSSIKEFRPAA